MPIFTIGSGGDYATLDAWAVATGSIDYGELNEAVLIEDYFQVGLFREGAATFPNGGRIRGDITVTGEPGVGRTISGGDGERIIINDSENLTFSDLIVDTTVSSRFIDAFRTAMERVIPAVGITAVTFRSIATNVTLRNCVVAGIDHTSAVITLENCVVASRSIIRADATLVFKNSLTSHTGDWLLGRGTYPNSETLVNYARIGQNAGAGDFGPGSSDYVVNYNSTSDMVDPANQDYRTKATSPLATAGEAGTFIGAFLEAGGSPILTAPFASSITANSAVPNVTVTF